MSYHIAQVNIGRVRAPLDDEIMRGFVSRLDEMKKRLAHLEEHGPSQFAFTFKTVQRPDESFLASLDWSIFQPCPATT